MMGSYNGARCGMGLKYWLTSVSLSDLLLLIALTFSLFNYGTVWSGLSGGQLIALRLVLSLICILPLPFFILSHELSKLEIVVLAYSLLLIIQGIFAQNPGNAVLQGAIVLTAFFIPLRFVDKYGVRPLLAFLFWVFLLVTMIMDIFAIKTGGRGVLTQESVYVWSSNYLFGSKFMFSYINMLFFGLFIYRFSFLPAVVPMAAFCIYCCSLAACSTGVVGLLLMLLIYICFRTVKVFIANKWAVAVCIVVMAFISIAAAGLMQLPAVQAFTVGVLGESSDFSGRLEIYPHLLKLWLGSPVIGFGSSNDANSIMLSSIGAPNTQEGFFQILFANGLVGGILFLAICIFATSESSNLSKRDSGIYAFVLAMAICSLVEINLTALFFLGLSLVNVMSRKGEQGFPALEAPLPSGCDGLLQKEITDVY